MTSSLQDMAKEQLIKFEAQWTRDFSVLLGQNLKLAFEQLYRDADGAEIIGYGFTPHGDTK